VVWNTFAAKIMEKKGKKVGIKRKGGSLQNFFFKDAEDRRDERKKETQDCMQIVRLSG